MTAVRSSPPAKDPSNNTTHTSDSSDLAMLATLLEQHSSAADTANLSDLDIAEELARLDAANGIAEGMEGKLDGLIGSLDKLLETLQTTAPSSGEGAAGSNDQHPTADTRGTGDQAAI